MKAILLNSTSTYSHLGCYYTTYGLKRTLLSVGVDVIYEVEVNNYDTSHVTYLMDNNPNLLLVINGEGTIHDDQPYACHLINISKNYADRTMLLNSQLRDMSDKYVELIKRIGLIQVRTYYDMNWCKSVGINNVVYCPDMLFYSGIREVVKCSQVKNENRVALFTDSHSLAHSKKIVEIYSKSNLQEKLWVDLHFSNSNSIFERVKIRVLYILSILGFKKYKLKYLNSLNRNSLSFIVNKFLNSSMIITGRYHAACMAIAFNKHLVYGNSNTTKIRDLCDDFSFGVCIDDSIEKNFDIVFPLVSDNEIEEKLNRNYNEYIKVLQKHLSNFRF